MAKTKNRIQLTGGVIVLGSLFWENETNCVTGQEAKGKLRQKWRDTSLNLKVTKAIALPVRYGRFSSKKNRKETYTMVLSKEYTKKKKLGKGLIIPFKNPISGFEEMKKQAIRLAEAEGIYTKPYPPCLTADWGAAVAIWINPASKKIDIVKQYWKILINKTSDLGYSKSVSEFAWCDGNLLAKNYSLKFKSIETDLDFLLFTYILPKHKEDDKNKAGAKQYPNAQEIASAMLVSGYQTYFCSNRASGIITSDDDKIISSLAKGNTAG